MDFITLTIKVLKALSVFGGYGIGIILLTILVRFAMWPLGVSQQRSMRTMQLLQPKMKAIQERYKSNPQVMQQKMMEFYKEHKFKKKEFKFSEKFKIDEIKIKIPKL